MGRTKGGVGVSIWEFIGVFLGGMCFMSVLSAALLAWWLKDVYR